MIERREPGVGEPRVDAVERGADLRHRPPVEKGLRPKARPSSSRVSRRTKISPSQIPFRIVTKAAVKLPTGWVTPVEMKTSNP